MIDDFDSDTSRFRFVERTRRVALESFPSVGVDLGFQCRF